MKQELILKEECFAIVGKCMEVHRNLGSGFLEIVYKDALEYEFDRSGIQYGREVKFEVLYKDTVLPHFFVSDFVVFDEVILEVKAVEGIHDIFIAQTINYLKVSGCKLGVIANFGRESFEYKRLVY